MRAFIRSAFLALSLGFSLLPGLAVAEDRTIVTTPDSDYFGHDLRTVQNVTIDQCKTECLGDQACQAFTYNTRAQWCFLKSDFDRINSFPGAVAGKVVAAATEPDIGVAPDPTFIEAYQVTEARQFKSTFVPPAGQENASADSLAAQARSAATAANVDLALANYKGALSKTADDAELWLEMAAVANRITGNYDINNQGLKAALNAYFVSRTQSVRARALASAALALDRLSSYRQGINAYKASLEVADDPTVRSALADLQARQGFRVTGNTVDSDSAIPRACVQFSENLVKQGVNYTDFVTLDGQSPKAVEAKDNQICVEGLTHGERYKLTMRKGMPSSVDEPLSLQVDLDIYVRDRSPMVRFTGDSFVLPAIGRHGVPIVSINSELANLKLYRVGDRSMASLMTNSQFLTQLDGYGASRIESEIGEQVWSGKIELTKELNKEVITSFPVDEALPQRKPGVYVLTAEASEGLANEWDTKATQWFVVSDIGLTTFAGTDGLNVFVRSLATAKPIANATVQLLARNNEILGTATTDANGQVRLSAGLLRGTAANVPAVLTATGPDGDYVFLDMTRAGFDLSDRGVTGRAAPGAVDVLAWTERGIYRAGETVHVAALARDIAGNAIEKLPLTFVFLRPDGVEDRRLVSEGGIMGGHALDLPLQDTSMRGTWTYQVFADPKDNPITEKTFLVDDFVPDRIEFSMASADKKLLPGVDTMINVDGRYLYGAPAAGLSLEGEIVVTPTRFRDEFKGYQFGLVDEEAQDPTRITLDSLDVLDDEGKASIPVNLSDLPSTTQFLNAKIVLRMKEAGGRAVERDLTLPVASDATMIGIKPEFDGEIQENSVANFTVMAIDAQSEKQAMTGLTWKLQEVNREYQWYRDGSSWRYEPINSTREVANGTLDLTKDGGKISVPAKWGRYRLEIASAEPDGPTSSVEFYAGWYVPPTSTETPDGLEIALDKDQYKVGDVAKLKVTSRYDGEVLVNVGSESLLLTKTQTVGKDGGVIELPVTEDWGSGSYVTATLFRPGNDQESRMPMRAIGVKWLTVDPGDRKLAITLEAPDKMLPRQPLDIDVTVKGAGVGEQAYVMLAAVDVGILNLTKYEAPDPDSFYFGQRMLGLEIRDMYGRLIDGSLGTAGRLRTGGDGAEGALAASPPTEKLVAFFSGPVTLDKDGKARISFDIPQFNGAAKLMAVAWSKKGVGHATDEVIIRDPVVVTASMPNFLAPDDATQLRLDIANTDGPAGTYTVDLATNDQLVIGSSDAKQTVELAAGANVDLTVPVKGGLPGNGELTITLSDGKGLELSQVRYVPVRPATLPVTERRLVKLEPGRSLTLNDQLLADSIMQGASVSVNVTRSPAFDVAALAMKLDRYPYGCAEQTTSRALPLLYLSEMTGSTGLPEDTEIKKRIQDAIYRVLSYQSSAGSFGLWSPGSGDLWLDAYVSDFLTRARELNYDVPQAALNAAMSNLQNGLSYDNNVTTRGNEMAYALYVLARNRKASISDMRYYADTMINDFPTPLARAHVAAALALYGDVNRSERVFDNAFGLSGSLVNVSLDRGDYGTQLRDDAAVLALAAESKPQPAIIPQLAKMVAREWETKRWTSTQEDAWMLLASRALKNADKDIKVTVNNELTEGGLSKRVSGEDLLVNPLVVTNKSDTQVTAVVTSVASPKEPLAAGGDGFEITRTYYTMDGEETNPSQVVQNERYVVTLNIRQSNAWQTRLLVADLLPAGFQIDNPSIVNSASLSNFDWLEETTVAHVEFRTDRFIAALDRYQGDPADITLAYVVRAVTPGTYVHPAATVEDMYRPQFSARTATGMMSVEAPGTGEE